MLPIGLKKQTSQDYIKSKKRFSERRISLSGLDFYQFFCDFHTITTQKFNGIVTIGQDG